MASVTRKTQGDRAERRRQTTDRMLVATEELLKQGDSFTELSVERLAAEAGISRSTFYTYYEDKGHLLRELTTDLLARIGEIASAWWAAGSKLTRSELRDIMGRVLFTYREHHLLFGAVADTAVYDPAVRSVFYGIMDNFIAEITNVIEGQKRAGLVPTDIPAAETAALLTWMTQRTNYQLLPEADEEQTERIADALTWVVWSSLYAGSSA